jgi:hypothetical protein
VAVPAATTSVSSDVITQALRGSITRSAFSPATRGLASEMTVPRASTTLAIR